MMQVGWRLYVKRSMDIALSALGLAGTAPIMLAAAAAVAITMGRPILFRQSRPGRHAKAITVFKFRTMREVSDLFGNPLPDAERLTPVGQLLRATSIDELPQLLNVVQGELSLVGPRPLLHKYVPLYSVEQSRRHQVLPGITGWAQINGRNALTWEEKFRLDVWYVDHWSLMLDLRILARTAVQVLRRNGISNFGHATMPEFLGSSDVSQFRDAEHSGI